MDRGIVCGYFLGRSMDGKRQAQESASSGIRTILGKGGEKSVKRSKRRLMYLKNRRKARVSEPGKGEKERWDMSCSWKCGQRPDPVLFVFSGHVKYFGFYSKYIGKALEDF